MSIAKNIFFISDLHIGGDNVLDKCDFEQDLINFLKQLEKFGSSTELILVGDIFSMREISGADGLSKINKIINNHKELFEQFKISGSIIKITLIVGNHDMEIVTSNKIIDKLNSFNIKTHNKPYLSRKVGNKKIWVEHGNQIDENNKYQEWGSVDKLPIGFYFNRNLLNKVQGILSKDNSKWLSGFINVHPHSHVGLRLFSNYFYRQMNPILRFSFLPFLLSITLSLVILIFIILQKYGIINAGFILNDFTSKFGIFGNVIDFIIFIDMILIGSILIIGIPLYLLILDLSRIIRSYELPINKFQSQKSHYSRIKKLISENLQYDIFIFGHTHEPYLRKYKINGETKYILNTGTWLKSFKKVKTIFKYLPPVFIATQDLNYFRIFEHNNKTIIKYEQNNRKPNHKYTFLEKLFTLGINKNLKRNIQKNIII